MNKFEIFNYNDKQVRTVVIDSEIWFVGKDVAEILGYSNPQKAIRDHVDGDDMRTERFVHPLGGNQDTKMINESGLYSLVISSQLPNAKKFKKWITKEVLPSLRKHGIYVNGQENMTDDEFFAKAVLFANRKINSLEVKLLEKNKIIETLQPKASYYDLILNCQDLLSTTTIAKDYGMSAKCFNKLLHNLGIQFFQSDRWYLYAKYSANGYTSSKTYNYLKNDDTTSSKTSMHWTQKGRAFLYYFLKEKGILPMIEREV